MKQYKGWEIAKMICEGTLKEGDILKRSGFYTKIFKVVSKHLEYDNSDTELGSSFLASNDGVYEIIQKPVSFDEVLKSDKKCRVEHDLVISTKEYEDFDILIADISNVRDAKELKDIMLNGRWYLED